MGVEVIGAEPSSAVAITSELSYSRLIRGIADLVSIPLRTNRVPSGAIYESCCKMLSIFEVLTVSLRTTITFLL